MDLAAKVASDWQKDNSKILASLKDKGAADKAQLDELRARGGALSHVFTSLRVWIARLEPHDKHTSREMRAMLKKIENILYGDQEDY